MLNRPVIGLRAVVDDQNGCESHTMYVIQLSNNLLLCSYVIGCVFREIAIPQVARSLVGL